MKNYLIKFFTLAGILFFLAMPVDTTAQCPMCRMSAESNLENGGTQGKGLNAGILYMLSLPYIMVAGLGFWWYKNRKTEEDQQIEELVG